MLVLFDIDGTLTRGGPAREAFAHALERTFGAAGPVFDHDFSGKTDPLITRELLTEAGLPPADIAAGLPRFCRRYVAELEARIAAHPVTALPGAHSLVGALAGLGDVFLGLVTGNLERGARLKLGSAGLSGHFAVGAFGSDHEDRNELPAIALRRASAHWGRPFHGGEAVVVGDTPLDVACGRAVGAATVGVATGRFSVAELEEAGADRVLPDLADGEAALEAVLSSRPP